MNMKKLYESFNHDIRLKLKAMMEDINAEVDKETWSDPEPEEHPEGCDCPECQAKNEEAEPVDNSDIISVDDDEEEAPEEDKADIVDFLTDKTSDEVEPNKPEVLSEFDSLSNEEKKALLLKLAKNDNSLDAILKMYMDNKCPIEANEEDETPIKPEPEEDNSRYGSYAVDATEMGEEAPVEAKKYQWSISNPMGIDTVYWGTEDEAHAFANKVGGVATKVSKK